MASSPAPRWQRLERDERREQILACASRLFSQRSYATVSTTEIAAEAGVARGLLNHYFGTKRELFLEVVRTLVRTPAHPIPRSGEGVELETAIAEAADRWLDVIERNQGMWLAVIGAQGVGHDPEVEAILDEARERAAARLIGALGPDDGSDELKAVVRSYGGMAEVALTRPQVRALVVQGFLSAVGEIRAAVESAQG